MPITKTPTTLQLFVLIAACVNLTAGICDTWLLNQIHQYVDFDVSCYGSVPGARSLAVSRSGGATIVYVSTRKSHVYALVDSDSDGTIDERRTVVDNMNDPNGIAWHAGTLYIAEVSTIYKYDNVDAKVIAGEVPIKEQVVLQSNLPVDTHHGWKYLTVSPDGQWLYFPVGAPCNICSNEDDPTSFYAKIWKVKLDGTALTEVASGVRNTVGMTFHPSTNDLWFTDNGADWLGNDRPDCELNHIPSDAQQTLHFGHPWCHTEGSGPVDMRDPGVPPQFSVPEFDLDPTTSNNGPWPTTGPQYPPDCSATGPYTPPDTSIGPHTAALGVSFYSGSVTEKFTVGLQDGGSIVLVAEHGSWNRYTVDHDTLTRHSRAQAKIGYRVSGYHVGSDGHTITKHFIVADGWQTGEQSYVGRPVDVKQLTDHSFIVSDDYTGAVLLFTVKPEAMQCPNGQTQCGDSSDCINTQSNTFHCGECDNECADGSRCQDSSCVCDDDNLMYCNRDCVDMTTHAEHCGTCWSHCNGQCVQGKCSNEGPQCPPQTEWTITGKKGETITDFIATDPETDLLQYSIISDPNAAFSIHKSTAVITVIHHQLSHGLYTLTLQVTDGGSHVSCSLFITVPDIEMITLFPKEELCSATQGRTCWGADLVQDGNCAFLLDTTNQKKATSVTTSCDCHTRYKRCYLQACNVQDDNNIRDSFCNRYLAQKVAGVGTIVGGSVYGTAVGGGIYLGASPVLPTIEKCPQLECHRDNQEGDVTIQPSRNLCLTDYIFRCSEVSWILKGKAKCENGELDTSRCKPRKCKNRQTLPCTKVNKSWSGRMRCMSRVWDTTTCLGELVPSCAQSPLDTADCSLFNKKHSGTATCDGSVWNLARCKRCECNKKGKTRKCHILSKDLYKRDGQLAPCDGCMYDVTGCTQL